jgi:hypothetical protein
VQQTRLVAGDGVARNCRRSFELDLVAIRSTHIERGTFPAGAIAQPGFYDINPMAAEMSLQCSRIDRRELESNVVYAWPVPDRRARASAPESAINR